MDLQTSIAILSGREDGRVLHFDTRIGSGQRFESGWQLSVGRFEDNDVYLRYDPFISRYHARLHWREHRWWLEDLDSRNGTYLEHIDDTFKEEKLKSIKQIDYYQPVRIGRTWICIVPKE
ncbi:hypothetical protein MASR2M15_27730 [Anaerolineales bacterium]